jgi:hypothetical protein
MLPCLQGLVSLHKSAGRSADGAAKLLQALQWHMQRGIMQVGQQAGAACHCYVPAACLKSFVQFSSFCRDSLLAVHAS